MSLKLYSTLTRSTDEFKPRDEKLVRIYSCGPTVYWRMQIGNLRAYSNWDILHRSLIYLGYDVERIVNLTDVGHMTEDEDFGDDKIEITAKKVGKTPREISDFYIETVLEDFYMMNFLQPDGSYSIEGITPEETAELGWSRATDHIEEMIDFNKEIEKSGYTYETDQALYFDVTKLDDYTALTGQDLSEKLVGVRDEVNIDPKKKNPADFVLWMKRVGKYEKHLQHWKSPWGDGFPGWHIECSAMGCKYLGEYIDIHTGGVDHISVHHTNERAQNIGAFGHPVVSIWMHNEYVTGKEGEKLSKSKGNAFTLEELPELGFDPLDLRYYFISIHYRMPIQFSKGALQSARNRRLKINDKVMVLQEEAGDHKGEVIESYKGRFVEALEDDLNISAALAVMAELLKSDEKPEDVLATVYDFDNVLGLGLAQLTQEEIPDEIQLLLDERAAARLANDYDLSDKLRDQLKELGYEVLDSSDGQKVKKI